jgi:multiple sugar transport system permease protein
MAEFLENYCTVAHAPNRDCIIIPVCSAFGIFDLIQVMTGGGPAGATETVSIYIYGTVMRYWILVMCAALVVVTFLLLVAAVAIAAYFLSRARA